MFNKILLSLFLICIISANGFTLTNKNQTPDPQAEVAQLKRQIQQIQRENQALKNQVNQFKNDINTLKNKQSQTESRLQVLENYVRTRSRAPYIQ